MVFKVRKGADIEKYGFSPIESGRYWWRRKAKFGRGGLNMVYNASDRRITVQSASSDCIAVLCEMYKNGDMDILPEEEFHTMKLTADEARLIEERRKRQ